MITRRLLRTIAVVIAVLAAFDPACTRMRAVAPRVAVLAGPTATDSVRALEFGRALGSRAQLVTGWLPGADAIVVIGADVPDALRRDAARAPVFVLPPSAVAPSLHWRSLAVPSRARAGERVSVHAALSAVAGPGDSLALSVRRDGLLLARRVRPIAAGPHTVSHALSVVLPDTGFAALDVAAELTASGTSVRGTAPITTHATPVRVLHHDVRPTWQGTFVRRVLAGDARVTLSSRVTVSRVAGTTVARLGTAPSGDAPLSLAALPAPTASEAPDVIVVGAADALADGDVKALDRWARAGGSVVLLLDAPPGEALQRWLSVPRWTRLDLARAIAAVAPLNAMTSDATAAPLAAPDSSAPSADSLVGRAWLVPSMLPEHAAPWFVLRASDSVPERAPARAVIWSRAHGRGTIVVAGALDAWVARATSRSAFATVWPRVVVEAAARRGAPASLRVSPAVATPGAWREAELEVADPAASAWRLVRSPEVAPDGSPRLDSVPFVPDAPGRWRAAWREREAGSARVLAQSMAATDGAARIADTVEDTTVVASAVVLTRRDAQPVAPSLGDVLPALAAWTGGRVLAADRLDAAADTLLAVLAPPRRAEPSHPMRSPWWLLPFVGALCGEWWLRRRAGHP